MKTAKCHITCDLRSLLLFTIHHLSKETFSCFVRCSDKHLIKNMKLLDFALTIIYVI